MALTLRVTVVMVLVWTAVAAGIVRAGPVAPPAGARLAAALAAHLGAAPEWAAPAAATDPDGAVAAATTAVAAWLQRRFPGADPLAAAGLPGHLARRAATEAGVLAPRELWALVAADAGLARAGRAGRPGFAPGRPDSALDPAHYAAEARLFWYRYEWVQRPRGESLWAALGAADPQAPGALAQQLVSRLWGYWSTYVEGGRPTPLAELLADADADGLPAGLEAELGTDPERADTDGDLLPDGADPEPLVRAIAVLVGGRPLDLAANPPLVDAGRVLLPLREVFTALGAQVSWDPAARRAEATLGARGVRLTAGEAWAVVWSGARRRRVALAPAARIVDGRMYVPLRFAGEALGATVAWQAETRTVSVTPGPVAAAAPADPRQVVYLTFDDGPDAELTPAVLDILAEYGVPATFFVVGSNVAKQPDLVRRMVAEGHAVGDHTWDHQYGSVYAAPEALVRSLDRAAAAIAQATGRPAPRLARAPGGRGTAALQGKDRSAYWAAAARRGYVLVDWNVSIGDAAPGAAAGPDALLANLRAGVERAGAGPYVVLMHDAPAHHRPTVAALPLMIEWFQEQGYAFQVLTPEVAAAR